LERLRPEENHNEASCTGASRNKKDNEKRAKEHGAEKGKNQPQSSPEIPCPGTKQLRVLDNPFEGVPAVSFGKRSNTNTEITDKAKCLMQR